jgi:hypothetical protein
MPAINPVPHDGEFPDFFFPVYLVAVVFVFGHHQRIEPGLLEELDIILNLFQVLEVDLL